MLKKQFQIARVGQVGIYICVMLLLAGCFRSTGEQLDAPTAEESLLENVDTSGVSADPFATPSSTPENINPLEGADALSVTQIPLLVPTLTPTFTPGIVASLTQPSAQTDTLLTLEANPSLVFITPGRSLDFLSTDTPTATLIPNEIINILPGTDSVISPNSAEIGNSTTAPNVNATTAPSGSSSQACVYVVSSGDTLFDIAISNNVSSADIRRVNPSMTARDPVLQIGQEINMPFEHCPGYIPPMPTIATASTRTPAANATMATDLTAGNIYVVRSGDTLFNIATRFGITVPDIVAANELLDPNRLSIGQELIIPVDEPISDE